MATFGGKPGISSIAQHQLRPGGESPSLLNTLATLSEKVERRFTRAKIVHYATKKENA